MKKLISLFIFATMLFATTSFANVQAWVFDGMTGGTTALDGRLSVDPGGGDPFIADNDLAMGSDASDNYLTFKYDASSAASEETTTPPYVVIPDDNITGTGAWLQTNISTNLLPTTDNAIARYHGVAGELQDTDWLISDNGILSLIGDYAGLLGIFITNNNSDAINVAGSVMQVTNDNGYWGLIGMTSSASTIGAGAFQDTLHIYNIGYADTLFTVDGNQSFVWYSDPTDQHDFTALANPIMELLPDGNLSLTGELDMGSQRITSVAAPTTGTDAINRDYLDSTAAIDIDYYFNDTTSDIGGIYTDMTNIGLGGGESTITTVGLTASTDDQALNNYASLVGEPGILAIPSGIFDVHVHIERTAGNSSVNIYAEIYKRATGGTETLIATTETSGLVTTKDELEIHANTIVDTALLVTDRIVVKLFANVGSGSGATVAVYQEGTTVSRLVIPATTDILSNIFVRQDATKEMSANWDIGPFTITGTRFISDIAIGTSPFSVTSTTVVSNLNADLLDGGSEAVFAKLADNEVITGDWDFGGAASLELVNNATPTTNATGEIALDTTITDHQPLWQYYDGAENMTIIAIDTAQLPALDNEIISYDAALDKFVLEAPGAGSGDLKADGTVPLTADWDAGAFDIEAKSFTPKKVSGVGGSISLYEENSTDTFTIGYYGPANIAESFYHQFSDTQPSGSFYLWGTPSGTGGPDSSKLSTATLYSLTDLLSLETTGTFTVPITTNPYAISAGLCYEGVLWYGATGEIDLPAGVDGMGLLIYNTGAFTVTIDPNGSEVVVRDGTVQTGGVSFTLSSGAGNFVGLVFNGTQWVTLGVKGTLAEGS